MDLQNLIEFLNRLSDDDSKTLLQRHVKASEELGELASALLPYESAAGAIHKYTNRSHVIEEVADTMLALYSIVRKVGATPEELHDMLYKKSLKWQTKQLEADAIKDLQKIPFEIHVSVLAPKPGRPDYVQQKQLFESTCRDLGVKPTILTLYSYQDSTEQWEETEDWMTSSVHVGTNETVDREMERIANHLRSEHWYVIRRKIETVPWHPAASAKAGCYFEKHWEVLMKSKQFPELFKVALDYELGVSRNTRKPPVDGLVVVSLTLRENSRNLAHFESKANSAEFWIKHKGFEIIDSIQEYAAFDTNVELDKDWLKVA